MNGKNLTAKSLKSKKKCVNILNIGRVAEQQRQQTVNLSGFPLRRCKSCRAHQVLDYTADVAQVVEHILGKNEVRSANLRIGSLSLLLKI